MAPQAPTRSIDLWPIERLVEYTRNPRKNEAAVDRMCGSIREFGFKIPFGWSAAGAGAVPVSGVGVMVYSPLAVITVHTSITPVRSESKALLRQMAAAMNRRWW
jgi:hypothetical protein